MKKLSERLEEAANLDIHMPIEVRELLEEAAELARRFEVSTVADVLGECSEYPCFYHIDLGDWEGEKVIQSLYGKCVCIVPEKEG